MARPERIGHYSILETLGAGGMGVVYRARDTHLNREVAIKVLARGFASDPERVARFEREAQAIAALSHPNIVAIHDFGESDGQVYAVTELLEGSTLREHIRRRALPPSKTLALARQIAEGLAAAHEQKIVHRDLKPENLFVTREGKVKILDFGLAKVPSAGSRPDGETEPVPPVATRPGAVLGTVGYMSPEQIRGEAADQRSDIFSLGLILYEMLSGRRAFEADSPVETMNAILHEEPEELDACNGHIPAWLARVVMRCIEKQPEARIQSVRDLGFALDDVSDATLSDAIAPALEPGLAGRLARGPWVFLLPAVALLAGLVVGRSLVSPEGVEPVRVRTLTFSGADGQPSASPDGRMIAFMSRRDGRPRIWIKQLAGGGEEPLTDGPDVLPRFSPDGSAVLFRRSDGALQCAYRIALVGGEPRELVEDVLESEWSPDGQQIAFLRSEDTASGRTTLVGVADARDGSEREVTSFENTTLYGLRWSPDGRWIAVSESSVIGNSYHRILLIDPRTGESRSVANIKETGRLSTAAWSGSGEALVFAQSDSAIGDLTGAPARVVRHDMATGEQRTLFWAEHLFPGVAIVTAGFARPDIVAPGRMVFDEVSLWQRLQEIALDSGPGRPRRQLTRGKSRDRQPVYSPDGTQLLFSSNRSGNLDLWRLDLASGDVRQLTDDEAQDWDPGFTGDGRSIVWSSDRSGNLEIWIADADGSKARQLTQDGFDAENPTSTPDGEWIFYWSSNPDKIGVWKIRSNGSEAARLVAGPYANTETSPGGRHLSFLDIQPGNLRTVIRVLEVESGSIVPFEIEVAHHPGARLIWGRHRWLPDGRSIAFVGADEKGLTGVFVQDFRPGEVTTASRRKLAGFSTEYTTESFGLSPDGSRLMLSGIQEVRTLMIADGIPDVEPPVRGAPTM